MVTASPASTMFLGGDKDFAPSLTQSLGPAQELRQEKVAPGISPAAPGASVAHLSLLVLGPFAGPKDSSLVPPVSLVALPFVLSLA